MVKVGLQKIIIDEERKEQIIVLKEKQGNRSFPITIGLNEAVAMKLPLSNITPPRPLTHDLLKSVISSLDSVLERVVIDKIIDSTFYAKLYCKRKDGQQKVIDSRPSDAIALALRMKSDVFVEEEVFDLLLKDM